MHKWYADDSALKKESKNRGPVFLFGGILISRKDEIELSQIIKQIKKEYTGEDMPVKYNIKDLEETYKKYDRFKEFEKLKKDSAVWRKKIIQESLNFDYKIFISCIENFQGEKKKQKTIKENLSSYLFANALMRVGLFSSKKNNEHTQVILDWPEGSQPKPFDKEYYYGYNRGKTSDGQEYYCGELSKIGFDQTLYYARCNHSNMLQLADIILGATRDWIETELQGRNFSIGMDLAKLFLPKFYGYPNNVVGRGINISKNNGTLKTKISEIIDKNLA